MEAFNSNRFPIALNVLCWCLFLEDVEKKVCMGWREKGEGVCLVGHQPWYHVVSQTMPGETPKNRNKTSPVQNQV